VPLIWRVVVGPMTLPRLGPLEEFAVVRAFVRLLTEGSLAAGAPKMIDDLMLENTHEPGSLRTAAFKLFVSLQRCEESFLHGVFCGGSVAQSKNGIFKKIIAVVVQPTTRIGRFIGGLTLCRVHTMVNILDQ